MSFFNEVCCFLEDGQLGNLYILRSCLGSFFNGHRWLFLRNIMLRLLAIFSMVASKFDVRCQCIGLVLIVNCNWSLLRAIMTSPKSENVIIALIFFLRPPLISFA